MRSPQRQNISGDPHGVVSDVQDCNIVVSLNFRHASLFTFGDGTDSFISTCYGLNSITALLQ